MKDQSNQPPQPPAPYRVMEEYTVYESLPWIRVTRQCLETTDGRRINDFHQLMLPDFVVVIAKLPDGGIVLNYQYKHGVRMWTYTLPGGLVDPGETPEEAARRELLEETGLISDRWHRLGTATVHGNLGAGQGHYFAALNVRPAEQKVENPDLETIQAQIVQPDELRDFVCDGRIGTNNHIAAVGLAALKGFL